jgi:hypothetical protein
MLGFHDETKPKQSTKLSESLESGFGFMGDSAKCSTLWHLERNFGVKPENFAEKPDELIDGLRRIFGAGTPMIERRLIIKVCSDFNIDYRGMTDLKKVIELARGRGNA